MAPVIGSKIKDKHSQKWIAALSQHLYPGEEVTVLVKGGPSKPFCDVLAVTNARVLAFYSNSVDTEGAQREVSGDTIADSQLQRKRLGQVQLVITTETGEEVSFGKLMYDADVGTVEGAVEQLKAAPVPDDIRDAMTARTRFTAETDDAWTKIEVIGDRPWDKAWKVLRDHAMPGETPWFVIGSGSGGTFAAFHDRCMIIKVGALTSMMSGSFGGGRVTTFHYTEITGIEYNSGMVGGVLEVLTASYQGSANKDYWRGSTQSRNADSNDPYTLSNTLPLVKPIYQKALPRLNEMRATIAEAKRPTVITDSRPVTASTDNLAGELSKLAALRDQGVLDDQEFREAKQSLIARYASS